MKRQISAKKVVLTSIWVDAFDIIFNSATALITGSVVMLAEAMQGLADLISALFVYIGLKRAKLAPNKKHPLGHGREIFIWSMLATLIMFGVLATLSFYLGYQRFIKPEPIENIGIALVVLIIALIANGYAFSLSWRRLQQGVLQGGWRSMLRSFLPSPMIETKTTFFLDMIGTLAALAGLITLGLYTLSGNQVFDGIGAMAIGLIMAVFAIMHFLNIISFLIGRSADETTLSNIMKVTLKVEGIISILDLTTLILSPERILVNIEINVQKDLKTIEIEKLIDAVKAAIKQSVPQAFHIQVEIETAEND